MASDVTLQGLANKLTVRTGRTFYTERLGGNVYGAVDYTGLTVTINGGQLAASFDGDTIDVLVCKDGERFDSFDLAPNGIDAESRIVTLVCQVTE